jgi:hypothetical protein
VRFPPGVSTVILPTVRARTGNRRIEAVLDGGAITASDTVEIEGECWIQIVLQGRTARIVLTEDQPPVPR